MQKLLILLLVIFISGCVNNPKRNRYLIPENFSGTVYIYYGVKDAPSLISEDGFRLIVVPNTGIVRTSSEIMPGKYRDEYLLYSGNKRSEFPSQRLGGGATDERINFNGEREIIYWFKVL